MINYECSERILHPPTTVFGAGIRKETWPSGIRGLHLAPKSDILIMAGSLDVRFKVGPLFKFETPGIVTTYKPAEQIIIQGECIDAETTVIFNLSSENRGQNTLTDFKMEIQPTSRKARMAEAAINAYVQSTAPLIASTYVGNINGYIAIQPQDLALPIAV